MHVHVMGADGEAKFWLEPSVGVATAAGLRPAQLSELQRVVEENADDFRRHWHSYFGPGE